MKAGDTVRFHAQTSTWSYADWQMTEDDAEGFVDFIRSCDGMLAEVLAVEVEGPSGETLYVDVQFQNGDHLDAICAEHFELVDGNVRIFKARAA